MTQPPYKPIPRVLKNLYQRFKWLRLFGLNQTISIWCADIISIRNDTIKDLRSPVDMIHKKILERQKKRLNKIIAEFCSSPKP